MECIFRDERKKEREWTKWRKKGAVKNASRIQQNQRQKKEEATAAAAFHWLYTYGILLQHKTRPGLYPKGLPDRAETAAI